MSYLLALIMCHMLLTDVHLGDKIMKTEWDTTSEGAHVIVGAEAAEDLIPTNCWLKKEEVPGRVAAMSVPLGAGRRSRIGHEEGARVRESWTKGSSGVRPISHGPD